MNIFTLFNFQLWIILNEISSICDLVPFTHDQPYLLKLLRYHMNQISIFVEAPNIPSQCYQQKIMIILYKLECLVIVVSIGGPLYADGVFTSIPTTVPICFPVHKWLV